MAHLRTFLNKGRGDEARLSAAAKRRKVGGSSQLVGQFEFVEWTGENHSSGIQHSLRSDDKRANDVRRETVKLCTYPLEILKLMRCA